MSRPRAQPRARGAARLCLSSLLFALALLLVAATAPASARRAGGGFGGFSRSSSSRAPVSSGYSYKPTYTPAAAAPKPASTSAPRPAGGFGSTAGIAGAASSGGALLGRRRTSSPLIVPFALGAGGGLLVSSALRSGQRCGDGRLECYREACAQAQGQCAPAAGKALRRAPCPAGSGFAECWASEASSSSNDEAAPDFVCNGKANPSGPSDVQAACLTPDPVVGMQASGAAAAGGLLRGPGGGGALASALLVAAAFLLV